MHIPEGKSLTDQSFKNSSDINQIIAHYQKTGILPQGKNPQYLDISQLPDFMEAHDIVLAAHEMFSSLPSDIRKEMGNDPRNLESYINDPKNHSKLVEHGMLHPSEKTVSEPIKQPAAETVSTQEETK